MMTNLNPNFPKCREWAGAMKALTLNRTIRKCKELMLREVNIPSRTIQNLSGLTRMMATIQSLIILTCRGFNVTMIILIQSIREHE